jgi:putative ABC transport system ATP-binding protein
MSESERSLWRGLNLGIVFQFFQLLPMLTLLENTMLPMDYCNVFSSPERPERAMQLLELVGLQNQAHKLPAAVSSGQQQAAAIARALATDPPIIVADEPTGNLDSRSSEDIIDLFSQLVLQGKTIILVTHDPSITDRTSRTLIISDGKIIDETVAQALPLLNHTQMLKVTQLLEHIEIPAGGTIIHKGEHIDYFFMIERGEVAILSPASVPLQIDQSSSLLCITRISQKCWLAHRSLKKLYRTSSRLA